VKADGGIVDGKAITTKFRYRIEPKPEGGFIARAEESAESIEGATREEVQQKLDDKLTLVVGEMLHNDTLTQMVGEMLHDHKKVGAAEFKLGGAQIRVNVTTTSSTNRLSQPATPSAGNLANTPPAETQFESNNKLWLVIALAVALGAVLMCLIKR